MELSKRLGAVAAMVTEGNRLADIGTDHGYIPIYLAGIGKVPSAIAMDINNGPLERAKENIRENGLEDKISTRLSNGLHELQKGETDTMIAAGMGGALVIRILSERMDVAKAMKEVILQPQSEIGKVRAFLLENGFAITKEDMVLDEGKYYPMMKAVPRSDSRQEMWTEEELEYGKWLLLSAHPVLQSFLKKEWHVLDQIEQNLAGQTGRRAEERSQQIAAEKKQIDHLLEKYFSNELEV